MFGLGIWEIAVILVVALLILGPEKLPKVARKLGVGVRELKRAATEFQRSLNTEVATLERDVNEASGAKDRQNLGVKEELQGIQELAAKAKRAKAEITGSGMRKRAIGSVLGTSDPVPRPAPSEKTAPPARRREADAPVGSKNEP